jgi:hypothetical protein
MTYVLPVTPIQFSFAYCQDIILATAKVPPVGIDPTPAF